MTTKAKYKRHGHYGTPLYTKWMAMKRRCLNKNEKSYPSYGGRGITVCEKWLEFGGFYEDMAPAFEKGLSLERIDNDLGYSKENCKWIPMSEQAKNKRSVTLYAYQGRTVSLGGLETELGISRGLLHHRIKTLSMTVEEAIKMPKQDRINNLRRNPIVPQ